MRTERVFIMLFVVAVVMKLLHIAGADIVMICTLVGLSFLYLFFGFYFFAEGHVRQSNIILSILAGILLASAPLGILFRLEYFSGSKIQVLFGAMFSLIVLLVVFIMRVSSSNDELKGYYRNMLARSFILFGLCLLLYFTPRAKLIEIQYWDDPQMVKLKNDYLRDTANHDNKKRLQDYVNKKSPSGQ